MVRPLRQKASRHPKPRKRRISPRTIFGAVLTALIIVPYMMGLDTEKYVHNWVNATNEVNQRIHLELVHYERHFLSAEGDLEIQGTPLKTPLTIHIKAYHGPLLIVANWPRLGLSYLTGTLDNTTFLGPDAAIKPQGTTEFTAFIPYFNDREVKVTLPNITIIDKANRLTYSIPAANGSFDSDSLIQLEFPSLKISQLDGTSIADINAGLLRIMPDNRSVFSAKNIHVHRDNDASVLDNVVIEGSAAPLGDNLELKLNLRFEKFDPSLTDPALPMGPFDFSFKMHGLNKQGLWAFIDFLKILGLQKDTLTTEETAHLIEALSHTISANTLFDLQANLKTPDGLITSEFHGGFTEKNISQASDFIDAFYAEGNVKLNADVMHMLTDLKSKELSPLLDLLKPNGSDYATTIDIKDGKITLNGSSS